MIISIIITIICIALATYAWNIRQKNRRLEELIGHTTQKLERLQIHFGRFTPDEVIEHLTENKGPYQANLRDVTVLFADLRDFTKMCEQRDPQEVVALLNGYFRAMSTVITRHHGQVTELTGDGILALFGALRNNPWQVRDAAQAALAMRAELRNYNKALQSKSLPELSFGIGIHRGKVLAGVMGNFDLSKFGVVGDTINVAARVESLTKIHARDILITTEVRNKLNSLFQIEELPPVQIKGKDQPIITYFLKSYQAHSTEYS